MIRNVVNWDAVCELWRDSPIVRGKSHITFQRPKLLLLWLRSGREKKGRNPETIWDFSTIPRLTENDDGSKFSSDEVFAGLHQRSRIAANEGAERRRCRFRNALHLSRQLPVSELALSRRTREGPLVTWWLLRNQKLDWLRAGEITCTSVGESC